MSFLKNNLTTINKIVAAIAWDTVIIIVPTIGPKIYPDKRINGDITLNSKTQIITTNENNKINTILFSR